MMIYLVMLTKRINLWMRREMYDAVLAKAAEERKTISGTIRELIRIYLKENNIGLY